MSPFANQTYRSILTLGAFLLLIALIVILWPQPAPVDEVSEVAEPAPLEEPELPEQPKVLGTSVEGRAIEVYTYGQGETHLLFVGGIHGGYEWNSVLLAYEMVDYLEANPALIPSNMQVSIIPVLNPDGLYAVVGASGRFDVSAVPAGANTTGRGRFNANGVDLNRNFDCKWQPRSTWRSQPVSAGTAPFSEPEAQVLRDYVLTTYPSAVVFWHSQANNVYASECEDGVLSETLDIMNAYASAARYGAVVSFDAYPVTGDAEGWLASLGIPALTVELETRNSIEWERNLAGVRALLSYYAN
jgi:g-D-glutamyl-meso-diaminopimelate peptidase